MANTNYYKIIPGKFCMIYSFSHRKPMENFKTTFKVGSFYDESLFLNLGTILNKLPIEEYSHNYYSRESGIDYSKPLEAFFNNNNYDYTLEMGLEYNSIDALDRFSYTITKETKYISLDDFISYRAANLANRYSSPYKFEKKIVKQGTQVVVNESDTLKWFFNELNDFAIEADLAPTAVPTHLRFCDKKDEIYNKDAEILAKYSLKKNQARKRPIFKFEYTLHQILREDLPGGSSRNWLSFLKKYINRYKREGANLGADLRILMEANNLKDFDSSLAPKPLCEEFMKKAPILSGIFVDFYLNETEYMLRQLMKNIGDYK